MKLVENILLVKMISEEFYFLYRYMEKSRKFIILVFIYMNRKILFNSGGVCLHDISNIIKIDK